MAKTSIRWTEETWNPVSGCSRVSAGCDNCYAETLTKRYQGQPGWIDEYRPWSTENAAHNVRLRHDRIEDPLHWQKPRLVFVNSMSDLFHEQIPLDFFAAVWDVMVRTPQHTYQILTKRPQRIAKMLGPDGIGFYAVEGPVPFPQPNIWLGTSIESWRFVHRADQLRRAPAAIRFISAEPLLDTLYGKRSLDLTDIDQVIVGGESGQGFRAMQGIWATDIRDHCQDRGVAFFFKQWGGRTPNAGGHLLEGREWNEMPVRPDLALERLA